MRIALQLILLMVFMAIVSASPDNKEEKGKEDVESLLTNWHHAAEIADAKTYFGSLAPGAIFLGTDATERWTKEEFQKWAAPYFNRPSAWTFVATARHIYLTPDQKTAWFDELLASKSYWTCRGSGVLIKTRDGWRILQYNLALTIPNEAVKEIRPFVEKALAGK